MLTDQELADSLLRMYGTGAKAKAAEYAKLNGQNGDLVSKALWLRIAAIIPEAVRRAPH